MAETKTSPLAVMALTLSCAGSEFASTSSIDASFDVDPYPLSAEHADRGAPSPLVDGGEEGEEGDGDELELDHERDAGELVDGHCPPPDPGAFEQFKDGVCSSCVTLSGGRNVCTPN